VNNFESFQKMRCFSIFTLLDARTWPEIARTSIVRQRVQYDCTFLR
jgi:hypothetical protein